MIPVDRNKLRNIIDQFHDLEQRMADPGVTSDPVKFANLSREHTRIAPVKEAALELLADEKQLSEIEEQLRSETDRSFRDILVEEETRLTERISQLESTLRRAMLPRHPDSGRNVYLEIRAGTGGEEAALFARDMMRMYLRFLEKQPVKTEIIDLDETGLSGIKEAVLLISGPDAWDLMHHEAGTHRVQRIPATESSGRIHTSAVTVAVIPEADESAVEINQNDLRIDVYRSSGAGGQHVNTTDSAVRITHIPTGIVVSCQDERSQIKNRARAMQYLRSRLAEKAAEEEHARAAAEKKAQVGSGDRSEKIRTYNFPQNRITDHRINFTVHNLEAVLEGALGDIIEALNNEEQLRLLESGSNASG